MPTSSSYTDTSRPDNASISQFRQFFSSSISQVRATATNELLPRLRSLVSHDPSLPALTGPYDVEKLALISDEPVTVTVSRYPAPGCDQQLSDALSDLASEIAKHPGVLGVGVFAPGTLGGPWQVVARFEDPLALRGWEESDKRIAALEKMSPWVGSSAVATAPTISAFFNALDATSSAHPVRKLLHDSLWSSPVSLTMAFLVYPFLMPLPPVPRVLLAVVIGTAMSSLTVAPIRSYIRRHRSRRAPLR